MKPQYRITHSSVLFRDPTFTSWIELDAFSSTDEVHDYAANSSLVVANATPAYPGFGFNGSDAKITAGDIGTIKTCMFWIKPADINQVVFQVNADPDYVELDGIDIAANGGGFAGAVTWYVDGIMGETLVEDQWNFVAFTHAGQVADAVILGNVDGVGWYDGEIGKFITSTVVLSAAMIMSFYQYYKKFYSLGT